MKLTIEEKLGTVTVFVTPGRVQGTLQAMPRVARIVIENVPHYITQRGNNRQDVFFTDDDRRVYLELLGEVGEVGTVTGFLAVRDSDGNVQKTVTVPNLPRREKNVDCR